MGVDFVFCCFDEVFMFFWLVGGFGGRVYGDFNGSVLCLILVVFGLDFDGYVVGEV